MKVINNYKGTSDTSVGYAVWNISERIRLYGGEEKGVQYSENKPKGTCVLVNFPADFIKDKGGN
jgi:hypothetical protein